MKIDKSQWTFAFLKSEVLVKKNPVSFVIVNVKNHVRDFFFISFGFPDSNQAKSSAPSTHLLGVGEGIGAIISTIIPLVCGAGK